MVHHSPVSTAHPTTNNYFDQTRSLSQESTQQNEESGKGPPARCICRLEKASVYGASVFYPPYMAPYLISVFRPPYTE